MARAVPLKIYSLAMLEGLGCGEKSWLFRRAQKEDWPCTVKKGERGQPTKFYKEQGLPPDIRQHIQEQETREKLKEHGIDTEVPFDPATVDHTALSYADAPAYNRRKFDKYANVLTLSEGLEGHELRDAADGGGLQELRLASGPPLR